MEKLKEIIKFYEEYNKLEQIIRTGWLMWKIPDKRLEAVSDHTLKVVMLCSVIIRELNLTDINLTKCLEMAFIHDLGEIKTGDIATLGNETIEAKLTKHEQELKAVTELLSNLSPKIKDYYISLWLEFEEGTTKEAILLKQIDKLDAVLKAHMYENEYHLNGLFKEFYEYSKQQFHTPPLNELYQALPETYKQK